MGQGRQKSGPQGAASLEVTDLLTGGGRGQALRVDSRKGEAGVSPEPKSTATLHGDWLSPISDEEMTEGCTQGRP